MHEVRAMAWVAWCAALISCKPAETNRPIAWRGRDVAGREVDLECDVSRNGGHPGGGDLTLWQERIREVVVAADSRGTRGLRITTRLHHDTVDPQIAVDFFAVDRDGALRPVRTFGSGARRYTARLTTATSELGWSRSLPLRPADFDPTKRVTFGQAREIGPPHLFAILPTGFGWSAQTKATAGGGIELALAPVVMLPLEVGDPNSPATVTALDWSAHLDAARVLVGEGRDIVVDYGGRDWYECDRFAWRETGVVQFAADRLDRLRAEGDALREAYRTMNAWPKESLSRLDEAERMPPPHAFDDAAAALRDYASDRQNWIEIATMRAIIDAIEKVDGAKASKELAEATCFDSLLAGRSLEKEEARELFELGGMIRWVEADRAACSDLAAAVARAAKRRLALDESDVALAEALVAAGIEDEDGDRQLELAGSPPPDADAIRKKIDAWVAGDGK